jgi:polysaccharide deacetylase family protein (PEP-CTERM system associated)
MLNALSFDLEEWYHPEAIRTSGVRYQAQSQAEAATLPLLALLREYHTRATFFTVGELAASQPALMESILAEGHELGFHGWTHKPLWVMAPDDFRSEIDQFLAWRDRDFPGVGVKGFRAPTFSLDHRTAWAIPILGDYGFAYDSSIFPASTPLYGLPEAPLGPCYVGQGGAGVLISQQPGPATPLYEIPMSVYSWAGRRIGFSGGLYLRALPGPLIRHCLRATHRAGRAGVFYVHPWETYPPTPRLKLSLGARLILYTGMASALQKLEGLLQSFRFSTMSDVFRIEEQT